MSSPVGFSWVTHLNGKENMLSFVKLCADASALSAQMMQFSAYALPFLF